MTLGGRVVEVPHVVSGRMAHFPVRSAGQFVTKIALGKLQHIALPRRDPNELFHYNESWARLKKAPTDLVRGYLALARPMASAGEPFDGRTVEEPIRYLGGPLRHTPPIDAHLDRAAQALLAYGESLAAGHAALGRQVEDAGARIAAAEARAALAERRAGEAAAQASALRAALDEMASSRTVRAVRSLRSLGKAALQLIRR
jgi:hypothetical protein